MLVSKTRIRSALACLGLLSGFAVKAAPVLQIENGLLTGATGVTVDGMDYDVAFQNGTCVALFNGCNDPSDFIFNTAAKATNASRALLESVLLDSALGAFDSNPLLTRGCNSSISCNIYLPWSKSIMHDGSVNISQVRNEGAANADGAWTAGVNVASMANLYAVWSNARPMSSTPIPEPGTLALLAVAGLAAAGTRSRRTK